MLFQGILPCLPCKWLTPLTVRRMIRMLCRNEIGPICFPLSTTMMQSPFSRRGYNACLIRIFYESKTYGRSVSLAIPTGVEEAIPKGIELLFVLICSLSAPQCGRQNTRAQKSKSQLATLFFQLLLTRVNTT